MGEIELKLALVVDTDPKSSLESSVQVGDIFTIEPVGDHIYIIKTAPIVDDVFQNGAGDPLTLQEKQQIIQKLSHSS